MLGTTVCTFIWNVFAMVHIKMENTPEVVQPAIIHDNDREVRRNQWRYNPSLFSLTALPLAILFTIAMIGCVISLLMLGDF